MSTKTIVVASGGKSDIGFFESLNVSQPRPSVASLPLLLRPTNKTRIPNLTRDVACEFNLVAARTASVAGRRHLRRARAGRERRSPGRRRAERNVQQVCAHARALPTAQPTLPLSRRRVAIRRFERGATRTQETSKRRTHLSRDGARIGDARARAEIRRLAPRRRRPGALSCGAERAGDRADFGLQKSQHLEQAGARLWSDARSQSADPL